MIFKISKQKQISIQKNKESKSSIHGMFSTNKDYSYPHIDELFKRFPKNAKKWEKTISINDMVCIDSKTGNILLLEHKKSNIKWVNIEFFYKDKRFLCINNNNILNNDNSINYNYEFYIKDIKSDNIILSYKYNSPKINLLKIDNFNDVNIEWDNIIEWSTRAEKIAYILGDEN